MKSFLCAAVLAASGVVLAAAPELRPLQPGAAIILPQSSIQIAPKAASGASLSTAQEVEWTLDYGLEAKKQILFTLITEAQYQALSAGKPAQGKALASRLLEGTGSLTVRLAAGNYFVAFTNQSAAPAQLTYRASTLRAK
jgi:hypothetical protein